MLTTLSSDGMKSPSEEDAISLRNFSSEWGQNSFSLKGITLEKIIDISKISRYCIGFLFLRPTHVLQCLAFFDTTDCLNNDNLFNLSGLNLTVKKGELIAVVGPVACGKTTLLMSLIQV